jgi:hypothetical protein
MSFLLFRRPARHALTAIHAVLAACALLILSIAHAAEPRSRGEIVVVTVHGTVSATMAGVTTPLYGGAILQLPATIRTGHDGALELRQGSSTFAAAANTELEIPQSAAADGLIERIVQIRGNAFYNVGKRERSRLRVETPYLVAVIKGTQFNVAAQQDSTTIALFEGRLEVRAADDSDVVDLHAGEIAIRHRGDVSISVLRMTAAVANRRIQDALVADSNGGSTQNTSNAAALGSQPRTDSVGADLGNPTTVGSDQVGGTVLPSAPAGASADILADVVTEAGGPAKVDTSVDVGDAVDVGVGAAVDLGAGSVTADVGVGVDVGGVSVDASVGAGVDLSAGSVTADIGAGVSAGDIGVDVGAGAAVDLGAGSVTADVSAGAGVGDVGVDVGVGAGVDLDAGSVTAGLEAGVGAGDIGADVGVDAGVGTGGVDVDVGADVDLGGVTADADVGVDVGTDGASVDVGVGVTPGVDVGAGVDVGSGGVSVDVGVGDILDVGIGLGSGGLDLGLGSGADDDESSGGLLGGLLRRRPRR